MSDFDEHLKWASAEVATWPKWKRNLLGWNITVETTEKRPYVSIDIETTGLDESYCQILEIGAIIDDGVSPVDKLPRFHCYVHHDRIVGEPYALSMHSTILKRIANHEEPWLHVSSEVAALHLGRFLNDHGQSRYDTLAAGKNFAAFDLKFLKKLPDFNHSLGFHHRCLDPGSMLYDPDVDFDGPPDTKTCMKRCGLDGDVKHTALEDAEAVIHMVRYANEQTRLSKQLRGFFQPEYDATNRRFVLTLDERDISLAGRGTSVNAVRLMEEIKASKRPTSPRPEPPDIDNGRKWA